MITQTEDANDYVLLPHSSHMSKFRFPRRNISVNKHDKIKRLLSGIYIKQNYMLQEFCSSLSGEFIANLSQNWLSSKPPNY